MVARARVVRDCVESSRWSLCWLAPAGLPVRVLHPVVDTSAFSPAVAQCCVPGEQSSLGDALCRVRADVDVVIGVLQDLAGLTLQRTVATRLLR